MQNRGMTLKHGILTRCLIGCNNKHIYITFDSFRCISSYQIFPGEHAPETPYFAHAYTLALAAPL